MSLASKLGAAARRAVTENVALKLIALIGSIGLFVIVRGTEDAQTVVPVEVVALLPPPSTQRMLTNEIPDEIRVTLRGSRAVLNSVRRDGMPPIQMDLRDAAEPFYYFDQDELELPAGTAVVQLAPAAVPLTWVDRAERRLPVSPQMAGDLAPGHLRVGTTVEPASVTVRGAASEVNRLESIATQPVDLTGLGSGRHERQVALVALPDHVAYVDAVSVLVAVTIEEEEATRRLRDVEVAVIGSAGVTVRPETVNVRLQGPRARIDDLHPRRVIPFVDVSELDLSAGAQPLQLQFRPVPDGMTVVAEPSEVLVVPAR